MNSGERPDLAAVVAQQANLESVAEAEEIVREVTGAMADHFDPASWSVVESVIPDEYVGEGGGGGPASQETPKKLFMDMGDREGLGTADAAHLVRIVAEAIRSQMSDDEVARLDEALTDDFLALFEDYERGELTTGSSGPTKGAEAAQPGQEGPDRED